MNVDISSLLHFVSSTMLRLKSDTNSIINNGSDRTVTNMVFDKIYMMIGDHGGFIQSLFTGERSIK